MRRVPAGARVFVAIAAMCTSLASSPRANATIPSVFNDTATSVPCAVQPNGIRLCDQTAFSPAHARSTVRTFDNVPIDVRVAFPPEPSSGPDGSYPLVMLFHRYGGEKLGLQEMLPWLSRGYATFSMTDRGFGESCGTDAARQADPSGCSSGYVRMIDSRYEVRDAQELAGLLADENLVDPQRIGAWGRSYGGAVAVALAALNDRKMLPDGTLIPWTSPTGTPMRIAAATPENAWTDLVAALVPNGSTLDYVKDAPYSGRTGILKQSWENALYGVGLPFFYAPAGADPAADLTGWHTLLNAGEPYDDANGAPLSAMQSLRDEVTSHHSAYYIDHSRAPAPLLMASGFTDDLFPADEAIRYYNRTRTEYPGASVSLFLASIGHNRGQSKLGDMPLIGAREQAWMDYYLKGAGSVPFRGVEALTQTCPDSAPSGGPYFASSWAAIAAGEVRFDDASTARIAPTAGPGSSSVAAAFDPISGGGACATAPATDMTGTATYRGGAVPAGGFTLMGAPTVVSKILSRGGNSQIAARLLDVDPSAGTETLVARGLWRPVTSSLAVQQVFQLHPNGYKFAAGHVVKLELLPNDNPAYGRVSNGQQEVRISNLQLRLPVLEAPGSLGGLVQSPAAKFLPPGYTLARDFLPAGYPRPRGAGPIHVALVPAFQACAAANDNHGAPLAFGSCAPPEQTSPDLTIGTPDANGEGAYSLGGVDFAVLPDDPLTAGDEADVSIAVTVTDVRQRAGLADYTGQLEARTSLRITDRASGPGADAAGTVEDTSLSAAVPCSATTDTGRGSTCSVRTSADALAPGTVDNGKRSIWEIGDAEVFDGGADGVAATAGDNALFMRQGLFVP